MFIKAAWNTRIQGVRFFIEECTVSEGPDSVNIVKNNCYAAELGASLVGEHLQRRVSVFKYEAFTFSRETLLEQFIDCAISVCVDSQPCMSNKKEENCPNLGIDELFRFSLFGVPNNYSLPELDEQEEE